MTTIATIGPTLPHDLLLGTGHYAGPVGWNIDRETPAADQWLESKYPRWCRSVLQDWASGALDGFDAVLFSRADDSAQRLYYYLCELQRQGEINGPEPLIFDAAIIARASSEDRTIASVRALAERLGLDDAALEAGIREGNMRRAAKVTAPATAPVCLIAGSEPPDRRIHAMIEATSWAAAGATLAENWSQLGDVVKENSPDPAAAIGRQVHSSHASNRAFFDRGAALIAEVGSTGARAALLWYAEEEEAQVWHLPGQKDALKAAGIPFLTLTRRDWRANDGIDVEITNFLKALSA